ncbi:glutathione peroxidase [Liquorilactobacillus mali]|uniref:Glutathione peroxidase n=1 Tax=Liquorilactobacillus mali TaxID=1618 RepID=A0A0R2FU97_9LACO|nr:glutathione peroxidase [Liquorilactobacillus mali]KRN29989.1 glutathione peroxidase [Liquorilactobacillus mali]MDN7144778.1 glutathione peroxidase [Liquorilactobacillus mali]
MATIYDFEVSRENGEKYRLSKYEGKTMLVVNTATKCGLAPQFAELEELYEKYKDAGLVILGFPSNQFKQELANGQEAAQACRATYGVSFPMHELTVVNGKETAPLFQYLKKEAPGELGNSIKWNFTKFLVDPSGKVLQRFAPKTKPKTFEKEIQEALPHTE